MINKCRKRKSWNSSRWK